MHGRLEMTGPGADVPRAGSTLARGDSSPPGRLSPGAGFEIMAYLLLH
jgi:hypothetical protein